MKDISQKDLILNHLRKYGSIEPLTALREYGCYRLGARIADLKKDGVNIKTERKEALSKVTGRKIMYANYILQ